MPVVTVSALQVASGYQPAGAYAVCLIEGVAQEPVGDRKPRKFLVSRRLLGARRNDLFHG